MKTHRTDYSSQRSMFIWARRPGSNGREDQINLLECTKHNGTLVRQINELWISSGN